MSIGRVVGSIGQCLVELDSEGAQGIGKGHADVHFKVGGAVHVNDDIDKDALAAGRRAGCDRNRVQVSASEYPPLVQVCPQYIALSTPSTGDSSQIRKVVQFLGRTAVAEYLAERRGESSWSA